MFFGLTVIYVLDAKGYSMMSASRSKPTKRLASQIVLVILTIITIALFFAFG